MKKLLFLTLIGFAFMTFASPKEVPRPECSVIQDFTIDQPVDVTFEMVAICHAELTAPNQVNVFEVTPTTPTLLKVHALSRSYWRDGNYYLCGDNSFYPPKHLPTG